MCCISLPHEPAIEFVPFLADMATDFILCRHWKPWSSSNSLLGKLYYGRLILEAEHYLSIKGAPGTAVLQAKYVRPCNSIAPFPFFSTFAAPITSKALVLLSWLNIANWLKATA